MMPRPDVSEERKNQILDAATNVFARMGLNKARMDDIVTESGLSKGALYWYFKSKDQLITAIVSRIFERELADLYPLLETDGTTRERLMQYIDHIIKDIVNMLEMLPISFEFVALAFRSDTLRTSLRKYYHKHLEILIPILEQGIERGEIRKVDPTEAAIAIGSIIEGTILLWVYDPETVDHQLHIRKGIELLLDGLIVKV